MRQDTVQFKFQPTLGDKYRYSMGMTDEAGNSMLPPDSKSFAVFKVAGVKEGKYTIHETMEGTGPDGKPASQLIASFRVDPLLNSEMIATDQKTDEGAAGAAMAGKLLGCFGVTFSESSVKVGDSWKPPVDANTLAKEFFAATLPDPNLKVDAEGGVTMTLEKLEEKSGSIKSVMHAKFDATAAEKGQTHHAIVTIDCDQTSVVDRATGVPSKIDRKFTMSLKVDAENQATTLIMHLARI